MPCSSDMWSKVSVFSKSPDVSSSSGLSRIRAGFSRTGVLSIGKEEGRGEHDLEAGVEDGVGERLLLVLPLSCFSLLSATGEA